MFRPSNHLNETLAGYFAFSVHVAADSSTLGDSSGAYQLLSNLISLPRATAPARKSIAAVR